MSGDGTVGSKKYDTVWGIKEFSLICTESIVKKRTKLHLGNIGKYLSLSPLCWIRTQSLLIRVVELSAENIKDHTDGSAGKPNERKESELVAMKL